MCELCGPDEHATGQERERLRAQARRLRDLASRIESMATGVIEPHTDAARTIGKDSVLVAHRLIKEWA